jgi:hypothetical protein
MAAHSACVTFEISLSPVPGDAIVQQPLGAAAAVFAKIARQVFALRDCTMVTLLVPERFADLLVLRGFFIGGSNILSVHSQGEITGLRIREPSSAFHPPVN